MKDKEIISIEYTDKRKNHHNHKQKEVIFTINDDHGIGHDFKEYLKTQSGFLGNKSSEIDFLRRLRDLCFL